MVLTVKLLVCYLCVSEQRPLDDRFRATDSERGRKSIDDHLLDDHSAVAVNQALLNKWVNR